jgi:hypothetical protein
LNVEWFKQRPESSRPPEGLAASERERRLQILTSWWKEQLGERINGYIAAHGYEIKNAQYQLSKNQPVGLQGFEVGTVEVWERIIRGEAQKRWAVARATANDYTSVVMEATWDEMTRIAAKMLTDKARGSKLSS